MSKEETVDKNVEKDKDSETENAQKDTNSEETATSEKDTDEKAIEEDNNSTSDGATAEDDEKSELEEMKDKYLRLYSEFENFRKRSTKEKLEIVKNANGELVKEILAVLDDFERAIKANEDAKDPEALKEGFKLIHDKLQKTLTSKGLKEIEAQGKPFDVDKHEAITQIDVEDDDQKGKVVDVVEKGYYLNDTVVRYAKVVVGK